eukprot:scaffold1350_cov56-Cyclotella_meneghiniana.AAC.26
MKLSFLPLALAPVAMVRGDDLSKYKLLSPAGYCVDSQGSVYSHIAHDFYYSQYPKLSYSDLVEKCAGWCLQNGPPQYKLLGFETYTKPFSEIGADPWVKCECEFDGTLPTPLPTYNPAWTSSDLYPGTGPMQTSASTDYLCYTLNSSGGSKSSKKAKSSSPHAKSAKRVDLISKLMLMRVSSKEDGKGDDIAVE